MKNYYKVLGVHRLASSREIKIAYRNLAIIYHPDRNQHPEAEYKIREINEAYYVLSDKTRRWDYDQKLYRSVAADRGITFYRPRSQGTNPFDTGSGHTSNTRAAHTGPVKRKVPFSTLRKTLKGFIPFTYKISIVSFIFCLFMLFDFFLPFRESNEMIVRKHKQYVWVGMARLRSVLTTNAYHRVSLTAEEADVFEVGERATIVFSRLAGVPVGIRSVSAVKKNFYATIYQNFLFIPAILLITSALGILYKRGNTKIRFTQGVVNLFILALGLFFLIYHKILL